MAFFAFFVGVVAAGLAAFAGVASSSASASGLRGRREARLRVEVVLVEEELAERVVQEPAVAVVAAVRVLELARVLDDLADVRPV